VVGAGAKVLGPFTVGAGARIGSNSVVLKPVEAGMSVVGIPARVVVPDNKTESPEQSFRDDAVRGAFAAYAVAQGAGDPLSVALHRLIDRVAEQDRQIAALREALARAGIVADAPENANADGFDAPALNKLVD
jgi:serine O-acetyltransferase